ncbi:hypothetical protein TSOC_008384, partial [Tetrabaena socialis]
VLNGAVSVVPRPAHALFGQPCANGLVLMLQQHLRNRGAPRASPPVVDRAVNHADADTIFNQVQHYLSANPLPPQPEGAVDTKRPYVRRRGASGQGGSLDDTVTAAVLQMQGGAGEARYQQQHPHPAQALVQGVHGLAFSLARAAQVMANTGPMVAVSHMQAMQQQEQWEQPPQPAIQQQSQQRQQQQQQALYVMMLQQQQWRQQLQQQQQQKEHLTQNQAPVDQYGFPHGHYNHT